MKFIRFNNKGAVELVTWTKAQSGEKQVNIEPFSPGAIELAIMAQSKHAQAYMCADGSVLPS